ncbi:hypothetical protein BFP72_05970 [Reichenbachiella sp. 5M10]|uniref:hypothetical protein n=1 Tax=Reichenbachiella sp. 5M10 TaxID=1889772 RepID=UPI000C156B77|nr:hypothetical protein [Reichenbachiella sp. 5M10]PIB34969.1 hypothetical protein BFP72_05970 [Reichenbachiella sp. 5M10]
MINETFFSNTFASFIAGLTSGVILIFLTKVFSNAKNGDALGYSMSEIKRIQIQVNHKSQTTVHNHSPEQKPNQSDDGFGWLIIVTIGSLYLTFLFLQFINEIIFMYEYILVTLITFLILTLVNQYRNRVISGNGWISFIIMSSLMSFFNFYTLHLVKHPYITEYAVDQNALLASADTFTTFITDGGYKATWFLYQMLGMFLLLGAILIILPVLTYYNASIQLIKNPTSTFFNWIVNITSNFSRPIMMLFISLVLNSLAFLMISGLLHHWLSK